MTTTRTDADQPARASMGELFALVITRVSIEFPGDGHQRPTDAEWERADKIVGRDLDRHWAEGTLLLTFQPTWRNRAWMRSQIKRHLARMDYQSAMALLEL